MRPTTIKKYAAMIGFVSIFFLLGAGESSVAFSAVEFGGGRLEAPFAATSTQKVNEALNDVATEHLGAESTSDVVGIATGLGGFFVRINTWLRETAGIDFFGILQAIGKLFIGFVSFIVNLAKGIL